jgi:hypothetical protein
VSHNVSLFLQGAKPWIDSVHGSCHRRFMEAAAEGHEIIVHTFLQHVSQSLCH